jgi:hypothetical protein
MTDKANLRALAMAAQATQSSLDWVARAIAFEDAVTNPATVLALLDENDRLRDALQSIREHVKDQPSALAHAIVATCDNAMKDKP